MCVSPRAKSPTWGGNTTVDGAWTKLFPDDFLKGDAALALEPSVSAKTRDATPVLIITLKVSATIVRHEREVRRLVLGPMNRPDRNSNWERLSSPTRQSQ